MVRSLPEAAAAVERLTVPWDPPVSASLRLPFPARTCSQRSPAWGRGSCRIQTGACGLPVSASLCLPVAAAAGCRQWSLPCLRRRQQLMSRQVLATCLYQLPWAVPSFPTGCRQRSLAWGRGDCQVWGRCLGPACISLPVLSLPFPSHRMQPALPCPEQWRPYIFRQVLQTGLYKLGLGRSACINLPVPPSVRCLLHRMPSALPCLGQWQPFMF